MKGGAIMSSGDKSKKQTPIQSKLLKLKDWLTVPDAARHLSILFGEEVSEADVLRLALDGKLKLSVKLATSVNARAVKRIPLEEVRDQECRLACVWFGNEPRVLMPGYSMDIAIVYQLPEHVVILNDEVWDLPMVGQEKFRVKLEEYKRMTSRHDVVEDYSCESVLVEDQNGQTMYEIQSFIGPTPFETPQGKFMTEGDYYPVHCLPDGSVLVVRTSALLDLQERFASEDAANAKPLGPTERRSLLKMILAMAVDGYDYSPDVSKSLIPQQIADAVAMNDLSIDVDTVRKWLKEAVKLPKNLE